MTRRLLLAGLLLLAGPHLHAQDFYTEHAQYKGVYVTPELPAWGFAIDIQQGILFIAAYGYDGSGAPSFVTFQSNKASASEPFLFEGSVFRTDSNGTRTEPIGTFTLQAGFVAGQPGALLDVDSSFLQADGLVLRRFGFVEDDPLDVLAGKVIGVLLTEPLPGVSRFASQTGNFIEFTRAREALSDGTPFLPGTADDPEVVIGFIFVESAQEYELVVIDGDETVFYIFDLVSHTGMNGEAALIVGDQASTSVTAIGTYVAERVNPPARKSSRASPEERLAALERAYAMRRALDR